MTVFDDLVAELVANDTTFRNSNFLVAYWDSLQGLTQAKKEEHQGRINAALVVRAIADSATLAALSAVEFPSPPGFDESLVDWEAPPVTSNVTVAGTVLENRVIHGKVSIQAPDCAVVNCAAEGRTLPGSGGAAVIDACSTSAPRFHIEDTRVTVPTPNVRWSEGVRLGPDATAIRVTVQHTVDGFAWHNKAGGTVQPVMIDCQAFDLTWFAVDPNHSDGSHNDAIQVHSPIGAAKILGGLFDAGPQGTAGLMVNVSAVNGLLVSDATFRGGRSGINFGPTPTPNAVILRNTFESDVAVFASSSAGLTLRGNTPNSVTQS